MTSTRVAPPRRGCGERACARRSRAWRARPFARCWPAAGPLHWYRGQFRWHQFLGSLHGCHIDASAVKSVGWEPSHRSGAKRSGGTGQSLAVRLRHLLQHPVERAELADPGLPPTRTRARLAGPGRAGHWFSEIVTRDARFPGSVAIWHGRPHAWRAGRTAGYRRVEITPRG